MKNNVSPYYKEAVSAVNAGLRSYMLDVFSNMGIGLVITAIVAYFTCTSQTLMYALYATGLKWLVLFLPLGIVLFLSARISKMSASQATAWFYFYALTIGFSLAPMCLIYTGESIASAFFISAAMFLSMVIYGYSTDKDLTGFGAFLVMALLGIIVASIVNLFIHSSATGFVISICGVLIFTGLTAFDAQRIKSYYFEEDGKDRSKKKAVFGALQLYLDFINLFLYVLRLFGGRRD